MPTSIHDQSETQDYYAVLSLPKSPPPSEKTIRNAYRHALLLHHPDKSKSTSQPESTPSVDLITTAYKTLVDPSRRKDYDRIIALNSVVKPIPASPTEQHPGLETIDLADMHFVADTATENGGGRGEGIYQRSCRCGSPMAYTISETELETYAEEGEIVTGCQGCSLWLRVQFASVIIEDEEEGG